MNYYPDVTESAESWWASKNVARMAYPSDNAMYLHTYTHVAKQPQDLCVTNKEGKDSTDCGSADEAHVEEPYSSSPLEKQSLPSLSKDVLLPLNAEAITSYFHQLPQNSPGF